MSAERPPRYSTALARRLCIEQTKAEELLWKRLRNRQILGAKFRRQHPMGRYILDFYCQEYRIAVELDGAIHEQPDQVSYDRVRRSELKEAGIRLLVFTNEEVFADARQVVRRIGDCIVSYR